MKSRTAGGTKNHLIRTATPASVRQVNRAILLELIRRNQPLSRADLADLTGIFRSSVSNIVDELLQAGLVQEREPPILKRGRTPKLLSLRESGLHVVGINIRPRYCQAALAGLGGHIRHSLTFDTPNRSKDFAAAIAKSVQTLARKLTRLDAPVSRIGISLPGHVDPTSGRVLWVPTHPELVGIFLMQDVEELSGVPATADNDCSAGVLSELWLKTESRGGAISDFSFLNVSDFGVGAGAVLKGEVYSGHNGVFATEFGHVTADPSGPLCYCGRKGCMELYTCNQATWNRYCPDTAFTVGNFERLLKSASDGDARAIASVEVTAQHLSVGLGNLGFALNPAEIVVAGRLVAAWKVIEPILKRGSSSERFSFTIRPARFEADDSLLHGAACLALRPVFRVPNFG